MCSAIIDNHAQGLRSAVIDALNDYTKTATETSLFSPVVSNNNLPLLSLNMGLHISWFSLVIGCI
jgi:hypothetical protein